MGRTLTYPQLKNSTVNRRKQRATYDLGVIHSIINSTSVLHVSFSPDPADPFPAILPMIGVMASYEYPSADLDEPMDCYLHGYVSSRVMNLARRSEGDGIAVCIAATKVDGLVLALTPNAHSYNYRSAVLFGHAKIVDTVEEKLFAMEKITNRVVPDRWSNSRIPPDGAEMQSTSILKVKIVGGSGKIRDGEPSDEDKDLNRAEVTGRVWTGVVPVWEAFGEPIPNATNKVEKVPDHITSYISDINAKNQETAQLGSRGVPKY